MISYDIITHFLWMISFFLYNYTINMGRGDLPVAFVTAKNKPVSFTPKGIKKAKKAALKASVKAPTTIKPKTYKPGPRRSAAETIPHKPSAFERQFSKMVKACLTKPK